MVIKSIERVWNWGCRIVQIIMIRYLKIKIKVEKCFFLRIFQFDDIIFEMKIYIDLNKITYRLRLFLCQNGRCEQM